MNIETSEIGFDAVEDWSVEDFYTFFHQVNILYNRLAVLEDIKKNDRKVKLKNALYGSLSRVKDEQRLTIKSIEIHSPGDFNLLGVAQIIGQLRGLLKDILFKNRQEREKKDETIRHQKVMNNLKEQAAKQRVLSNQIQIMQGLGYDQEQIDIGIKALSDPLEQIQSISVKKQVALQSPNE